MFFTPHCSEFISGPYPTISIFSDKTEEYLVIIHYLTWGQCRYSKSTGKIRDLPATLYISLVCGVRNEPQWVQSGCPCVRARPGSAYLSMRSSRKERVGIVYSTAFSPIAYVKSSFSQLTGSVRTCAHWTIVMSTLDGYATEWIHRLGHARARIIFKCLDDWLSGVSVLRQTLNHLR
jgi:hypothetical protein